MPALPNETVTNPGVPSNRVYAVMAHTPWYQIEGRARLARDVGCSRSTITRLISGRIRPSLHLAQAVTESLCLRLKRSLSVADVFAPEGTYAEPSTCVLCGCKSGCMPPDAYDRRDQLKPEYRASKPGDWCRYPASDS